MATMNEFFTVQMDYIYFVYGLAFVLVAAICATMREDQPPHPPWIWLGLFGLCHGVHEWLEMLAFAGAGNRFFSDIRYGVAILMMLSFVFLLEFGRAGWHTLGGKGPGQWVIIPLTIGAIAGGFTGLSGLNVTTRYALGLTGGLWSAITLVRASRIKDCGRPALILGAVAMAGYAIAAGAVVPQASFPLVMAINRAFLSIIGIPVQLVRALLAVLISASLWMYHEDCSQTARESRHAERTHHGFQLAFAIAAVLTIGWFATELAGRHGDHDIRESIQNDAALAASSLNPEDVSPPGGAASDPGTVKKSELQRQLTQMQHSHPQIRGLYLMRRTDDGHIVSVATSGKSEDSKLYRFLTRKSPESECPFVGLLNVLAGAAATTEVYSGAQGSAITAFAPVHDSANARIIAVLAVEEDASQWRKDVSEFRLGPIVATFLVSVLLIVFFVTREQAARAAKQIAEARDLLEEKVEARTQQLQAAQSRLVMQEKMASVGHLAAGIAHEISSPLTFVNINFRTLQEYIQVFKVVVAAYRDAIAKLDNPADVQSVLDTVRRTEESSGLDIALNHIDKLFEESRSGFHRVIEIVNSMRDFSRMDDPSKFKLFNINKSVHDALIVGQNSYKYHAETETKLGDVPDIQCVPDLINRVLLNLVVNAAQAIADQKERETKGRITISTWSDADNVYCEVADNGPGITPENQKHVFEPFFTTKDIGKGTGLGLSLSYDTVVVKHGGDLTVNSTPGKGTQFLVRLPIQHAVRAGSTMGNKQIGPGAETSHS
jgi:signal transduction histidine kinase